MTNLTMLASSLRAFSFHFLCTLWVAALLLTGSARAQSVPYTQFDLPNGLHVILVEDHSLPVVTVNMWYHVGSGNEKPKRTGFAHLFEHLMFEGSKNVKEGDFDILLEEVGGDNNGSTTSDRTNYYITVPSNALDLALFLESDRMGYLLDTMTPQRVDGQREVVKNELRQSYANRPYGMSEIKIDELLFPPNHPYHWPTIGYMEDLNAATHKDVADFFKQYYVPNNASLVVAGDINPAQAKLAVEKWFGEIPAGAPVLPVAPLPAELTKVVKHTMQDKVQLPRLDIAWVTPAHFRPGDAELDLVAQVLAGNKNSRLYKRLVYDLQIAQEVSAYQASADLASTFHIVLTPRPGHTVDELRKVVDEELAAMRATPVSQRELDRARNGLEASYLASMENMAGFGGKADVMNGYWAKTGNPDYFQADLNRYRVIRPVDLQATVDRWLPADRRVELTVIPEVAQK